MDQPNICEILGVNVGERFRIDYPKGVTNVIYINDDGLVTRVYGTDKNKIGNSIVYAINHPESIIREKTWTWKDIECRKAVKTLYPKACSVRRDGLVEVREAESDKVIAWLHKGTFPSVNERETAMLEDIK